MRRSVQRQAAATSTAGTCDIRICRLQPSLVTGVTVFSKLGDAVNRTWLLILICWVAVMLTLQFAAPSIKQVARDGEFDFLPADVPSRQADELLHKSFKQDLQSSSIVIVINRVDGNELTDEDRTFVSEILKPRLRAIADEESRPGGLGEKSAGGATPRPLVARIRAFDDEVIGPLMVSDDRQATVVIVELVTDYGSHRNRPFIAAIEGLLAELARDHLAPAGIEVGLTGIAVVGRDIGRASEASAAGTELWTIILVVGLTLAVYRAPLLALIPLITLYFTMSVSLRTLALLADAGVIGVFKGIEAYSTVIVYASGVDYSLFLISRFKEELAGGADLKLGVRNAIAKVGDAITASSATEILGVGMLTFASFGKFHEAGIAISFSLCVMLLAVLTLTPALLLVAGRAAFWPGRQALAASDGRRAAPLSREEDLYHRLWEGVAEAIVRRPGRFLLVTTALMVPFAALGALWYNHLSYDLVGNLPGRAASVAGTKMLQQHFAAGTMGPVSLLICNEQVDFGSPEGREELSALAEQLQQHQDALQIADFRSVTFPLGTKAADNLGQTGSAARKLGTRAAILRKARDTYVGGHGTLENHVTRIDLLLAQNPFSEQAIDFLGTLENRIRDLLPEGLRSGSELYFSGPTASLRDLKAVGAQDRTLINVLVVGSVFLILVVLLRRVILTVYLLFTVLFSYLVTLGITFGVFYLADPAGFQGLDWTVPLFLFTVLIAIGEDYNILLVTRIHEEQEVHGAERGVAVALARTGPIISSCGFIMSGTFLSLWIGGQLARMTELGFALACGVLLDTFVVRPILVPAYLILIGRSRFGAQSPCRKPNIGERRA